MYVHSLINRVVQAVCNGWILIVFWEGGEFLQTHFRCFMIFGPYIQFLISHSIVFNEERGDEPMQVPNPLPSVYVHCIYQYMYV